MKGSILDGTNMLANLNFEREVDLQKLLNKVPEYSMGIIHNKTGMGVFFEGNLVARCFKKYDFHRFLEESEIDWQKMLSKKPLPDDAMLVILRKTLFIIEAKYQQMTRLIDDEELLLCDFKRKQYLKLVAPLGLKVEYVYVLNNWFKKPEYKDVLDYINSVNCHYKFNELPLAWLGLPTKKG